MADKIYIQFLFYIRNLEYATRSLCEGDNTRYELWCELYTKSLRNVTDVRIHSEDLFATYLYKNSAEFEYLVLNNGI